MLSCKWSKGRSKESYLGRVVSTGRLYCDYKVSTGLCFVSSSSSSSRREFIFGGDACFFFGEGVLDEEEDASILGRRLLALWFYRLNVISLLEAALAKFGFWAFD